MFLLFGILLCVMVPLAYAGEYVVYDDDPVTNFYQCWWPGTSGDEYDLRTNYANWVYNGVTDRPHSGSYCGEWRVKTIDAGYGGGGGVILIDKGWSKTANVSTATGFSVWLRGKTGAEKVGLTFISLNGANQYNSASFPITSITTNWKKFSYTKTQIYQGAAAGFDLGKFFAVEMSSMAGVALIVSSIYIDDMKFNTVGVQGEWLIDSDDTAKSLFYRSADVQWISGTGSIGRMSAPPGFSGGTYYDRITGNDNNSILQTHEGGGTWTIKDISIYPRLTFGMKGASGTEALQIILYDNNNNPSNPIDTGVLDTSWQEISVYLEDLVKGTSFDPTKLKYIEWSFVPGGAGTVYLDNFGFPNSGEMFFRSASTLPVILTNTLIRDVKFTLDIASLGAGGGAGAPIGSVKLDLTKINGPSDFGLTNVQGTSVWQGFFTTATNPFIKGGIVSLPVVATNIERRSRSTVSLTVRNAVPVAIENAATEPATITNAAAYDVMITARAVSRVTNVKSVYINLTSVGGGSAVLMTNVAGTSNWQTVHSIPAYIPGGLRSFVVTASDTAFGRGTATIPFLIVSPPSVSAAAVAPALIQNDKVNDVLFSVQPVSAWSTIQSVNLDLSVFAGPPASPLTNAGAGRWKNVVSVAANIPGGDYVVPVTVSDAGGLTTNFNLTITVKDVVAPTAPSITSIASNINSVILTWSTSADETGILGYKVYQGRYPGFTEHTYFVGSVDSWTNRALDWGQEYFFSVSAVDTSSNESAKSTEWRSATVDTLIVYDGDTVPAKIDGAHWDGFTPWADDATYAHSGTLSGYLTDFFGGYIFNSQRVSPYDDPDGVDITQFQELRFWIMQDPGSAVQLSIAPYFRRAGGNDLVGGNKYDIPFTPGDYAWNEIVIPVSYFTNSSGIEIFGGAISWSMDPKNLMGIDFGFDQLYGAVFIDDMRFVKGTVSISTWSASPSVITNNAAYNVEFEADVTGSGTLSSVEIDLSEVGGSAGVAMTNLGGSQYRYTWAVPVQTVGVKNVFVRAVDTLGNSQTRLIRVTNLDRLLPTAPTALYSRPNDSEVRFTWAAGTDETAVAGYKVSRGTTSGVYDFTTNVPAGTTYNDPNLANGTTYYFVLQTIDSSGNLSAYTPETSAIPHTISITSNLTLPGIVTNVNNTAVTFFIRASGSLGVVTNVSVDLAQIGGPLFKMIPMGGDMFFASYPVSAAVSGADYILPVYISDDLRMIQPTTMELVVLQPPTATNGIAVQSEYTNTMDRTIVFRMTARAGIANITTASLMLSSIGYPNILMTNISGNTLFGCSALLSPSIAAVPWGIPLLGRAWVGDGSSDSAAMALQVVDLTPPSNVTSRTCLSMTNGIGLVWDPASDESGIAGYKIYRGTATGALTLYATIGNVTSWTDIPTEYRLGYYYAIKAVDAAGNISVDPSAELIGSMDKRIEMGGLVIFDGDTVTRDYQCWWPAPTTPANLAGNWLYVTNVSPHSGANCGEWVVRATSMGSGGGVIVVDGSWSGVNDYSTFSKFSVWLKGKTGSEVVSFRLFERQNVYIWDGSAYKATNYTYYSGEMKVDSLTTSWQEFSFTREQILTGADPQFLLTGLVGVELFNGTTSGLVISSIYVDDMILQTVGAPEQRILDGDAASSDYRTRGAAAQVQPNYGSPTITAVAIRPVSGAKSEKLSCLTNNGDLALFNIGWAKVNIRGNNEFSFSARGETGGESLSLRLVDSGGKLSPMMHLTNLSTNWAQFSYDLSSLLAGTGFNRSEFYTLRFLWTDGPATVYFDDMIFMKYEGVDTNQPCTNCGPIITPPSTNESAQIRPNYITPDVNEVTFFCYLETGKKVAVDVYDLNGVLVKNVQKPEMMSEGQNFIVWNLDNYAGRKIETGLYFAVITIGNKVRVQKILVVR
jgi:hypothetical protein